MSDTFIVINTKSPASMPIMPHYKECHFTSSSSSSSPTFSSSSQFPCDQFNSVFQYKIAIKRYGETNIIKSSRQDGMDDGKLSSNDGVSHKLIKTDHTHQSVPFFVYHSTGRRAAAGEPADIINTTATRRLKEKKARGFHSLMNPQLKHKFTAERED